MSKKNKTTTLYFFDLKPDQRMLHFIIKIFLCFYKSSKIKPKNETENDIEKFNFGFCFIQ